MKKYTLFYLTIDNIILETETIEAYNLRDAQRIANEKFKFSTWKELDRIEAGEIATIQFCDVCN